MQSVILWKLRFFVPESALTEELTYNLQKKSKVSHRDRLGPSLIDVNLHNFFPETEVVRHYGY